MLSHADLPDDIAALKALLLASEQVLRERDSAIARHDEIVAGLREQLTTHGVEIEHLKLMIAKLRRMQFGRKSEKLDHQIEQLELQLEGLQATEGEVERDAADAVRRASRCRPGARRASLHAGGRCLPCLRRRPAPSRRHALPPCHSGPEYEPRPEPIATDASADSDRS